MAVTALIAASNRYGSDYALRGDTSTVALDAVVAEYFTLPTGFGSLLIKNCIFQLSALSGAYVAPAPAYDGVMCFIVSSDGSTWVDNIGSMRYVHIGTSSARPTLSVSFDLNHPTLLRLGERLVVTSPVLAGAGVTGTVTVVIRGARFQTG